MCGIIAVVCEEECDTYVKDVLVEGMKVLQNRGYDSAGIGTVAGAGASEVAVTKRARCGYPGNAIEDVAASDDAPHAGATAGIGHTRWATHGRVSVENAHPHLSGDRTVAVAHNGTISNHVQLREELAEGGATFAGETDSELIAHLISSELSGASDDDAPHYVIERAVGAAVARLQGTWGLAVVWAGAPGCVVATCHGSPLVVGFSGPRKFAASEPAAIAAHTKDYLELRDGETATLRSGMFVRLSGPKIAHASQVVPTSPAPFEHWMIREIMEQPESLRSVTNDGGRIDGSRPKLGGIDAHRDEVYGCTTMVVSACGSSLYAGMYGVKLARRLKAFEAAFAVDAGEVDADVFHNACRDTVLCVLSQSGETKDTLRAVDAAASAGVPCVSLVNVVGSSIARKSTCGVYLSAGREQSVASTKAFSAQVVAMALVAAWFCAENHASASLIAQVRRAAATCDQTLSAARDSAKLAASLLVGHDHVFVLGKGFGEPIALEGALKIKEVSYVHAEGFSGGALKHGPLALISESDGSGTLAGTPVVLIVLDDEHKDRMMVAAQTVRSRGASTVIVTDLPRDAVGHVADVFVPVCANGMLTALSAAYALQIVAYEMAVAKGLNPDMPRNLAKSVTVD